MQEVRKNNAAVHSCERVLSDVSRRKTWKGLWFESIAYTENFRTCSASATCHHLLELLLRFGVEPATANVPGQLRPESIDTFTSLVARLTSWDGTSYTMQRI